MKNKTKKTKAGEIVEVSRTTNGGYLLTRSFTALTHVEREVYAFSSGKIVEMLECLSEIVGPGDDEQEDQ